MKHMQFERNEQLLLMFNLRLFFSTKIQKTNKTKVIHLLILVSLKHSLIVTSLTISVLDASNLYSR